MISNKRIWLIGASSGIGRELAVKLAASANTVIVSGRNIESLNEVATHFSAQHPASGGKILPLQYDVTDDTQTEAVGASISALTGGIDVFIYCAGRCEYVNRAELSTDLFRRVYDVNLFGMINALSAVLPSMKSANPVAGEKPQVVGIASLSALAALPRAEAYGSSKAAVTYCLEALRLDLGRRNVDVTVVNPGFVETPMTAENDFPMPFMMQADEAADRIIQGIAKRKRTVNFPRRLTWIIKLASFFTSTVVWFFRARTNQAAGMIRAGLCCEACSEDTV